MTINVTHLVDFELNDGEVLPITQCVCGAEFSAWAGSSSFTIGFYPEHPKACPKCNRKLYFAIELNVYQVEED